MKKLLRFLRNLENFEEIKEFLNKFVQTFS